MRKIIKRGFCLFLVAVLLAGLVPSVFADETKATQATEANEATEPSEEMTASAENTEAAKSTEPTETTGPEPTEATEATEPEEKPEETPEGDSGVEDDVCYPAASPPTPPRFPMSCCSTRPIPTTPRF